MFYHKGRDICTLVHGDDCFSAGTSTSLDRLQVILEKKYELKTQRIGGSDGAAREGKILNRVVRYTKEGSSTRLIQDREKPLSKPWK